ncbi:hypothetical protein PIB30_080859 [Stylosanthes scabra]|uniref:Uncharacterized protein n=1 Tax=Stylosanthes scabra TaxID=79078 RepID=A0ABU6VSR7_9FABA|nr:hypothetical protein [Stylosanthes scabra]
MGSGVVLYEYEKHEKYEGYDEKVDAELGVVKIRRYHFDDEAFTHPLHSIRFDLDHPYELLIKSLLANKSLNSSGNGESSAQGSRPSKRSSSMPHYSSRRSSSLRVSSSLPAKGWMCDKGREEEKKEGLVRTENHHGGGGEEEEPAEPRPMDVDANEDYLQYLEELQCHPESSPLHGSPGFAQCPTDDSSVQLSDGRSHPSFNLFGVWSPAASPSQ